MAIFLTLWHLILETRFIMAVSVIEQKLQANQALDMDAKTSGTIFSLST